MFSQITSVFLVALIAFTQAAPILQARIAADASAACQGDNADDHFDGTPCAFKDGAGNTLNGGKLYLCILVVVVILMLE